MSELRNVALGSPCSSSSPHKVIMDMNHLIWSVGISVYIETTLTTMQYDKFIQNTQNLFTQHF